MVTHILKLIKAQFRSNSWVLAELLVVFVVMWFMADYFLMQGVLMNRPVGFKLDNVYQAVVSLRPAESPSFIQYEEGSEEPLQNFERIIERIGRHPDVEVVGLSYYSLPYTFSNMGDGIRRDSIRLNVRNMMVSPDYLQVFGIHSAEGESPEEMARKLSELVSTKDLMISGELARSLFDRTDILGKEVYMSGDSIPKRIVVVTEPVRNDEYDAGDMNVFFTRMDLTAMQREWGMKESDFTDVQVTFRTRPGSTLPDYAQHFLKEMKLQLKAGNFWVSDIKRFENIRADFLANSKETNNRKLFSALGVFFLVNVFLAVIGTFWFRVNRRRSELGLRMAVGSTRSGIQTLMIGEGVVLLTLAALPALLVCANLVWMDLLSATVMPAGTLRFLVVSLITWATLALTIILATWYPSRKASHLEPAEALHYE
ncbi:FtsX-like permease family protein [Parabacteroides faecis]|uniref:FtsX-like permease family protein n=1 Tax=Parabacteroides TaxID=375288 RepID=UPI000EFF04FA|nr:MULTISPECIES: FtsX-like permease family protein [Parabacteroides]MBC8619026.1 FtsX-like permease family protein [Parabacteroides faecis]RHS00141.1 cell division protein FtsX [Parabacteroides sp. AF14-59]